MFCEKVMESVIKIEKTKIGDDDLCYPAVKEESGWSHRERRMGECKNCKLMKSTNSRLNERLLSLMNENEKLEKNNTELEEMNGSLILGLQFEQREIKELKENCTCNPDNGSQETIRTYREMFLCLKKTHEKLMADNIENKKEINYLREKLADMQKQVNFQDDQLNKSRIRFSKINQEYLTLKLKYGEDESSDEPPLPIPPSKKQFLQQFTAKSRARSEIIPASYLKKESSQIRRKRRTSEIGRTLICEICAETFPTGSSLRSHTGHCRKKMGINDLSFSRKATPAKKLSPSISKDTPRTCPICDRVFARPCNLGRHQKTHLLKSNEY